MDSPREAATRKQRPAGVFASARVQSLKRASVMDTGYIFKVGK